MLPLQQRQPSSFRLKMWCEHSDAVRFLTFNEQQVIVNLFLKNVFALVLPKVTVTNRNNTMTHTH